MIRSEYTDSLRQSLAQSILDQLTDAVIGCTSLEDVSNPVLRFEAFLQDGEVPSEGSIQHQLVTSTLLDLSAIISQQSEHVGPRLPPKPAEARASSTSKKRTHSNEFQAEEPTESGSPGLRNELGALRPAPSHATVDTCRQMEVADFNYPKRARVQSNIPFSSQEASLGKFVNGLWEHIHAQELVDPAERGVFGQLKELPAAGSFPNVNVDETDGSLTQLISREDACSVFKQSNTVCRNVSHASRTFRAVEVIVQANWVEHFDSYADFLARTNPGLSHAKCRKATLIEACRDFGWSEKELRNKMAIWKGYKEIKDAAGWAALVFAGMGLYRFCKYRSGLDKKAMEYLRELRPRIEVAADTLQPQWRQLLAIVGESTQPRYTGHPHDWAVALDGSSPVSLASTYEDWDPGFSFQHLENSVIDSPTWGADDPRLIPPPTAAASAPNCSVCHLPQSEVPKENQCWCFPSLFGGPRRTLPVQVFRTGDGRRNGLMALVSAERGTAIGEFVGLVTRGVDGVDVMNSSTSVRQYQIWQGHQGNYTRFINHSCNPNSQFEHFSWMGTQHIILVSKGIDAGTEITVDYSESYWSGLDKRCLCGESCCRYSG